MASNEKSKQFSQDKHKGKKKPANFYRFTSKDAQNTSREKPNTSASATDNFNVLPSDCVKEENKHAKYRQGYKQQPHYKSSPSGFGNPAADFSFTYAAKSHKTSFEASFAPESNVQTQSNQQRLINSMGIQNNICTNASKPTQIRVFSYNQEDALVNKSYNKVLTPHVPQKLGLPSTKNMRHPTTVSNSNFSYGRDALVNKSSTKVCNPHFSEKPGLLSTPNTRHPASERNSNFSYKPDQNVNSQFFNIPKNVPANSCTSKSQPPVDPKHSYQYGSNIKTAQGLKQPYFMKNLESVPQVFPPRVSSPVQKQHPSATHQNFSNLNVHVDQTSKSKTSVRSKSANRPFIKNETSFTNQPKTQQIRVGSEAFKHSENQRKRRSKRKNSVWRKEKESENVLPLWSFQRSSSKPISKNYLPDDSDEEETSSVSHCSSTGSIGSSSISEDEALSDESEASELSVSSIIKANKATLSNAGVVSSKGVVSTFWDIENCRLPCDKSAVDFVKYVRNMFYEGRRELDFFVACDVSSLNEALLRELDEAAVIVVHISSINKNAADKKLLTFLQAFQIEHRNENSAVVLISGDSDFASFLNDMRYKHHIFVNLICNSNSRHSLVEAAHKSMYFEDLIKTIPARAQNMEVHYVGIISNLPHSMKSKSIKNKIALQIGNKNCRFSMINKSSVKVVFPSVSVWNRSVTLLKKFAIAGNKIETSFYKENIDSTLTLQKEKQDGNISQFQKKEKSKNIDSAFQFQKKKQKENVANVVQLHEKIQVTEIPLSISNIKEQEVPGDFSLGVSHVRISSLFVYVSEMSTDINYWRTKFGTIFGATDFQLHILQGTSFSANIILSFKSLNKAQKARNLLIKMEKGNKMAPKFIKLIKHDNNLVDFQSVAEINVEKINYEKAEQYVQLIEAKKQTCLKKHEKNICVVKSRIESHVFGVNEAVAKKLNELNEQKQIFLNFTDNAIKNIRNLDLMSKNFDESINFITRDYSRECNCISIALPIYAKKNCILKKIEKHQVVIIRAETGSGKSTQLCQYIWRGQNVCQTGLIICTQPRKIAAISLAKYVSTQIGCAVGDTVGYEVGMSRKLSENTAILYTTDFTMLKMMINNNISHVSCIVIDEAHERTVYTDLLLGIIKKCLKTRQDLKIIITSATIDISIFSNYFNLSNDSVLEIPGQTFPVEDIWLDYNVTLGWDYFSKSIEQAYKILGEESGDILTFLTTPVETEKAAEVLSHRLKNRIEQGEVKIFYLHGKLDVKDQQKVFECTPVGKRKVVFSTNCAETSLTIPGIKYVVDCGMVKEVKYDARRNMNIMAINFVSQSSANQRRGRAGRTQTGKCYHLYSKFNYDNMEKYSMPEILCTNLGNVLLKIMKMGVTDPLQFDFVQSPPRESLESAFQQLIYLKAVNDDLSLSEMGKQMSYLPLEPRLSHLVFKGIGNSIGFEASIIAALITVSRSIFFRNNENKSEADIKKLKFCQNESDFLTYFNVYKEWTEVPKALKSKWCVLNCINARSMRAAHELVNELTHILQKELDVKLPLKYHDDSVHNLLLELIFDSFSENLCVFSGHPRLGYKSLAFSDTLMIHPSSSICTFGNWRPQFIVYDTMLKTNQTYLMNVSPVSEQMLSKVISDPVSLEALNSLRMKKLCIFPLGDIILYRYFIGKGGEKRKLLEKKLKEILGSDQFFLDIDSAKRKIDVFSSKDKFVHMRSFIMSVVAEAKERLMSEEKEINIFGKPNTLTAVISNGAEIKEVILPGEFRDIKVTLKSDVTISSVIERLEVCGKVIAKRAWKNYFKVTFDSVDAAKKSIAMFQTEESFSVQSIIRHYIPDSEGNCYSVFVSLLRLPCTGIAFVTIEPTVFLPEVSQNLNSLCYRNCTLNSRISRKTEDICFSGLPANVIKEEFENLIKLRLPVGVKIKKCLIVRKKPYASTKEEIESIKQKISDVFAQNTSKKDIFIDIKNVSTHSHFWNACVRFRNSLDAQSAVNNLENSLHFSHFKPLAKASIWCKKDVFAVIKEEIDEALNFFKDSSDSSKSLDIQAFPKGMDVKIQITANNLADIIDAQKCISSFVLGDQIKCQGNHTLEKLFSKSGLNYLKNLSLKNPKCYIYLNSFRKIISIFGSISACNSVKMEINSFLNELNSESSKEIILMAKSEKPGVLRELLMKYGFDLKKLTEACDASEIEINSHRHILTIKGSQSSISECENIVQSIKNRIENTYTQQDEEEVCPVCQIQVSHVRHHLEYCGHAYCKECLLHLFQSMDIFPMVCLACSSPIVITDISWAIKEVNSLELVVYKKSLNAFIQRKDDLKYCPSPDCAMIFKTTSHENIFECPSCGNAVCTNCEELYHYGMSCSVYQCCKTDDDHSLKIWMNDAPKNRKICPSCSAPIEKMEAATI